MFWWAMLTPVGVMSPSTTSAQETHESWPKADYVVTFDEPTVFDLNKPSDNQDEPTPESNKVKTNIKMIWPNLGYVSFDFPDDEILGKQWDSLTLWEQIYDPWELRMGSWDQFWYGDTIYARKHVLDPKNNPALGPLMGGVVKVLVGGVAAVVGEIAGSLYGLGWIATEGIQIIVEGGIWTTDDLLAGRDPQLVEYFLMPVANVAVLKGVGVSASAIKRMLTKDVKLPPEVAASLGKLAKETHKKGAEIQEQAVKELNIHSLEVADHLSLKGGRPAEKHTEALLQHNVKGGRLKGTVTPEQSYLKGERVSRGTKDSVRPDFDITFIDNEIVHVELKAYERVWSSNPSTRKSGIRDMVRTLVGQIAKRDINLRLDSAAELPEQAIFVDLRAGGRQYSKQEAYAVVREIANSLSSATKNRVRLSDVYPIL